MQQPSDAERWRRVRDILHKALELPSDRRDAYLADACRGENALRAEVESLIAASERATLIDEPDFGSAIQGLMASVQLKPGQAVSHYRIAEKIGEGGMGSVYKAVDTLLGRSVALKVITDPDANRRRRFAREAKAASALNHPNIVTIYEFNSENGVDFIAMEYVEGVTLGKALDQPLDKLLGYARQAAAAIACAHEAGIVHRDLKPNNIMVTSQGVVKVLDFGLAKHQSSLMDPEATRSADLTREGDLLGTPAYISPEQILGEEVGPAADVFCFGIILYEIASGRRPFGGNTALATLDQVVHKEPPSPGAVTSPVNAELNALIQKCLKKSPADRPESMAKVAAALESISRTDGKPTVTSRRTWIAGGLAGAVVVAAAVYFGRGTSRPATPPVLTYSIEAQKPGEDKPYVASASETFEALWKFRLHLQPPPSGFLYVVNQGPGQDGTEQWWVLYSAPVMPGAEVVTGWYVFDQNPGTERLWLVWAPQAIADLAKSGKIEDSATAAHLHVSLPTLQSSNALVTRLELRHK